MSDADLVIARTDELLRTHPPARTARRDFLGAQFDAGLAWVHFPVGLGGLDTERQLQREVHARLVEAGAPDGQRFNQLGYSMGAPTLLAWGDRRQQERRLRPLFVGAERWCQLFSEPGAGSDLAGAQTTAVLDGEEWIVNGQKVWTSGAQNADYGMLVARTDWDQPKHRGLTYLIMPMKQPGVEVRPLKQMNRQATFNEVFFTDARVPSNNVVGEVGSGWQVALTTLMHERAGAAIAIGVQPPSSRPSPRRDGPIESWRGLVDLARRMGKADDPVVRDALARFYIVQEVARLSTERARAARRAGRPPGPEGSLGKLARSIITKARAELGMALLGAAGLLDAKDAPMGGIVQMTLLSAPSSSIAGGTDEVQKNILGERILGLPKEPGDDRDRSFREVRQNLQSWMQDGGQSSSP